MIVTRKITGAKALAEFFRGTPIASGSNMTTAAASPNVSVPAATPGAPDFSDVEVGDRFYISGQSSSTVFLVQTKTDDQNIVLDNNVTVTHTGDAIWRAVKNDGFNDPSALSVPPLALGSTGDAFVLIYDSTTFGPDRS